MNRIARLPVLAVVGLVALVTSACPDDGGDPGPRRAAAGPATTTTAPTTSTTAAAAAATTTTTTLPPPSTATTAPPPPTTAAPAPAPPPPAPSRGTLAWSKCGALQCATLAVPRDYADPSGPTIDLALARKPATSPNTRIGSLVFNPGGPGNSGVDGLSHELGVLTPALKARFDIVSFDPRGIGRSAPVRCRPAGAAPSSGGGDPIDPAPTTEDDQRALLEGYRAYAAACAAHSGDILGRVGTDSTAEDLERIRIALGDDRLTFIGHSAGTFLGAVYADRYPQRVRALVLDGAVDPSLSLDQRVVAQAAGFERALDEFFAWCAATGSCAWRPGPDLRSAYLALMDRIRQQPLPASGDEVVGIDKLVSGTMGRLTSRSRWASLGDALAAADRGDGAPLATLASGYRNGGASNAADARMAITCLDHASPRDPAAYPALADATRTQSPVFGPVFVWSALACGVWHHPATLEPKPVRAAGAPPILVVGTTGDPATPQAWAEALAAQLEQGVLVLRQGAEHVAYYYSSCVRALVDAYLIDGRAPADGTRCAR